MQGDRSSQMRRTFGWLLWLEALIVLVVAAANDTPIDSWHDVVRVSFVLARVAFLFAAGVVMREADEEVESLKRYEQHLSKVISDTRADRAQ